MEKKFGAVSADGHLRLPLLPFDLWEKRLPRRFRDNGPRVLKTPNGVRQWVVEGRRWSRPLAKRRCINLCSKTPSPFTRSLCPCRNPCKDEHFLHASTRAKLVWVLCASPCKQLDNVHAKPFQRPLTREKIPGAKLLKIGDRTEHQHGAIFGLDNPYAGHANRTVFGQFLPDLLPPIMG